MKSIQRLSGQEYVEMYASEAKAEIMKKRNYLQDNEKDA
jgi:hypothetical protein